MGKKVDYKIRARLFSNSYKSQSEAAKALGIHSRSLRRYMQGTRQPLPDLAKRMNERVYRRLKYRNVYGEIKIGFDDGEKVYTHSSYRGDLKEIEEAMSRANDIKADIIESGKEAGKAVKSMKIKMVWRGVLPKYD